MPDMKERPHRAKAGWLVQRPTPYVTEQGEPIIEEFQVAIDDKARAEAVIAERFPESERGQIKAVTRLSSWLLAGQGIADGQVAQWQK
ncbi:MAG: hypothetical protein BGP04_00800 [Rhizobiales bacterium 62-17]|nr:hypothetical protein [Hyphomicrobiales bacterium]OJY04003.1 MAG: hypothetical protein BGP04_00800 [Rhizobiales bacterium 62-17]